MEIEKIAIKEQIVKMVVKSGNGGAVWVPKDWLGKEVIVILPQKPKMELKEKIIHTLEPYLKDIVSVSIYGSYARNEQEKLSDVDILVLTKNKDLKMDIKNKEFDVVVMPADNLKKAIKKYPVIYYQMVREAKPLINEHIIEELKDIKIRKNMFKSYLKETGEHIKSNKTLIELDKISNTTLKSFSVLYSTVLRLRGLLVLRCILKTRQFSNKKFKEFLIKHGLKNNEFKDVYEGYRIIRDGLDYKKLNIKIEIVERLINILEDELELAKVMVYGKQEKKA